MKSVWLRKKIIFNCLVPRGLAKQCNNSYFKGNPLFSGRYIPDKKKDFTAQTVDVLFKEQQTERTANLWTFDLLLCVNVYLFLL